MPHLRSPSLLLLAIGIAIGCNGLVNPSRVSGEDLSHKREAVEIGRSIFFDTGLSRPKAQACASCHDAKHAFADPRPVSPGAVAGREGRRNSPSLMYAALIPPFAYDEFFTSDGDEAYAYEGGLFHDGRARDLFEQVQQPFFDPQEMNLASESQLADLLRQSDYGNKFREWVGDEIWKSDRHLAYHAYRALVEFLKEPLFRPFDARIDDYLAGDTSALSEQEKRGLKVFREDGKCADCHLLEPTHWEQPLLSDFGYDNLGVPTRGEKDPGLGGHTGNQDEIGQFRSPSLRNVALTAPYMHNGSIATLREVMDFYNKRDVEPQRWGATDYPQSVNHDDMGKLNLNDQQIEDLVALMQAFTDRTLLRMKSGDALPNANPDSPATREKRLLFPDWTHRLHPAFPKQNSQPRPIPE